MTIVAGLGLSNFGPSSALRFAGTRGRIQGSPVQGVNYPSPFFDVAHTYLPTTIKQMFRWCRYYFLTNPLINATVFKLAEYPVTDVVFEHEDASMVKRYDEYFQEHLLYRSFMIEVGLDYFCYGNSFVSVGYPMRKYISCRNCDFTQEAKKCRADWIFTNYSFRLTCPKCGHIGDASARDIPTKDASGIRLIRWNPEDIEVEHNDLTGTYTYFYTIPPGIRNDVVIGRKEVVEQIPQLFIQALKEQKGLVFSPEKLFHMRRPTLATHDRGWGIPLLLGVLKDTFYLQLMKKAQEAILLEHILPLRTLFPQPASGSSDPFSTINLADWREHVAMEIARWRHDPNYIPILPLPVGSQTIGGDGKVLLLTGEIQQWSEQIIIGMGVPREFLYGGMSYAGTNVSMRMLENAFLGYILRHKGLLRFIQKELEGCLGWPSVRSRFKPFKMADDLQRKALDFQLNQAQKISDRTLLTGLDYDADEETRLILQETEARANAMRKQQVAMAEVQGEAQLVMMRYQAKAQQEMQQAAMAPPIQGEPGDAQEHQGLPPQDGFAAEQTAAQHPQMGAGEQFDQMIQSQLHSGSRMQNQLQTDATTYAYMQAQQLAQLDATGQELALRNLQLQSPELADLVRQFLHQVQGPQAVETGVDMRPLPDKLPPRRTASPI